MRVCVTAGEGIVVSRRKIKPSPGPYLMDVELRRDRIPDPHAVPVLPSVDPRPRDQPAISPQGDVLRRRKWHWQIDADRGDRRVVRAEPGRGKPEFHPQHAGVAHESRRGPSSGQGPRSPADSYFLRAESFFTLATEIERLDREPGGGLASSTPTAAARSTSNRTASRSLPCSRTDFAAKGST